MNNKQVNKNKVNTFFGPVVHKGKTTIDSPGNTSTSNTFEIKAQVQAVLLISQFYMLKT